MRGPWLNSFHAHLKLEKKEQGQGGRLKRVYEKARTPLARVLVRGEVCAKTKEPLRRQKTEVNPFALQAEVERRLKEIEALRWKKWVRPKKFEGGACGQGA